MYLSAVRPDVSQGDVLKSCPAPVTQFDMETRSYRVETRSSSVMVVTYDCEYDKPACRAVLVASVVPMAAVPQAQQGPLKQNRVYAAFYLPELAGILEESFVNLREMVPVPKALISAAAVEGRVVSLTDEGQLAFQDRLVQFLGQNR